MPSILWSLIMLTTATSVLASVLSSCPAIGPSGARYAVLFLHGLGFTGNETRLWLEQSDSGRTFGAAMARAGVRMFFPSATDIPYTLAGGRTMSAWYDRTGLPPTAAEHQPSVDASVAQLEETVDALAREGIPPSRVAVGGFSQGGGIALQLAYRGSATGSLLAGVFVLSSYANDDSPMWAALDADGDRRRPPLFQRHGAADDYILASWGEVTAAKLQSRSVAVDFAKEPRLGHQMSDRSLTELSGWLARTLSIFAQEDV